MTICICFICIFAGARSARQLNWVQRAGDCGLRKKKQKKHGARVLIESDTRKRAPRVRAKKNELEQNGPRCVCVCVCVHQRCQKRPKADRSRAPSVNITASTWSRDDRRVRETRSERGHFRCGGNRTRSSTSADDESPPSLFSMFIRFGKKRPLCTDWSKIEGNPPKSADDRAGLVVCLRHRGFHRSFFFTFSTLAVRIPLFKCM